MSKQQILFKAKGKSINDVKQLIIPKIISHISTFEFQFGVAMPIKYVDKRVLDGVVIKCPVRF